MTFTQRMAWALVGVLATWASSSWAQMRPMTMEVFGKNRLQYKSLRWEFLSTPNFDIYYYQDGAELGQQAAIYAEAEFNRISELLGYSPYNKTKLFIYNSKTDLRQSNVGLENDNNTIGGKTNFVKSIIEVPYTGSQSEFKKEINRGIAQTLLYDMMYGGSFRDMVQNSYLLTLPEWFIGGAALYAAEGWSVEMDDRVRDAMRNNQWGKLVNLEGPEALIAGHSMWNYIAERYGKSSISNILNLTRILRNEQTSIGSTLGVPFERVMRDWRAYYLTMAEASAATYVVAPREQRLRKLNLYRVVYGETRLSASGRYAAYTLNDMGRVRVVVEDLETGKRQVVLREGYKVLNQRVDYRAPMLAWHADKTLFIMKYRRGRPQLVMHDRESGKQRKTYVDNFSQVNSMDASADGRFLLLSADQKGKTDLYLLAPLSRKVSRITADIYDDRDPRFVPGSNRIVWTSNRQSDSLASKAEPKDLGENYNLWLYDPATLSARKLANTPWNEMAPRPLDSSQVLYLSDASGVWNLRRLDLSTGQSNTLTEYRQGIGQYDVDPSRRQMLFTATDNGREWLYLEKDLKLDKQLNLLPTKRQEVLLPEIVRNNLSSLNNPQDSAYYVRYLQNAGSRSSETQAKKRSGRVNPDTLTASDIDIRNYVFESEKLSPKIVETKPLAVLKPADPKAKARSLYKDPSWQGPFPYKNRLSIADVVTNLTIDPLMGLGIFMESGMTDMFENHKIRAGVLAFTDLRSSNMHLEYQFLKYRVDFHAKYFKRSLYYDYEPNVQRYNLDNWEIGASWPLSVASRVNLTPFLARTTFSQLINQGSVLNALPLEDKRRHYWGLRAEYVFDNTLSRGMNMLEGTRAKVRFETYASSHNRNANFSNFQVDARHYQKIHKELVAAFRGSYGTFFGRSPKTYLLGGVDNWLFRSSNVTRERADPLNTDAPQGSEGRTDWLFMQYVTPMRGFDYNTMYGTQYLVFNAELRFPVVRYLYRGPITSNFLRNLQLTGFYDVGTAWSGRSPFGQDNSFNTNVVGEGTNFRITVRDFRNPFLQSYGAGIRSMMLGYYLKIDLAQGIKDYNLQPLRLHVSLGHDF